MTPSEESHGSVLATRKATCSGVAVGLTSEKVIIPKPSVEERRLSNKWGFTQTTLKPHILLSPVLDPLMRKTKRVLLSATSADKPYQMSNALKQKWEVKLMPDGWDHAARIWSV
jgi:hypothetical protein